MINGSMREYYEQFFRTLVTTGTRGGGGVVV